MVKKCNYSERTIVGNVLGAEGTKEDIEGFLLWPSAGD